ncbi:zinc finger protein 711-like [Musca autumnalis]|uniref:zinc finger protein 711-like n=1 Tax=Musca autumnalis TaxID=221902 RepID=UPI003CEC66B3
MHCSKEKMSEQFSIKVEPFTKVYKQENSNNDTHTPRYNDIKLEYFTNMENDINEDELDLDDMEEFLPENNNESTIDKIKEEEVDGMDEPLSEDSPSIYSPSSLTCKSDDFTKAITNDEVQYPTNTRTQQISLPKLELMDVHTDEDDDSEGGDTDSNVSDNNGRSIASSSSATQTPTKHKCELCGRCYENAYNLRAHIKDKHPSSIDLDYICKICNQRLATQTGLDRHCYRTHPETRKPTKYKCEPCGISFTDHSNLRRHIRNKHPISLDTMNETPEPIKHKCEICGCRYKQLDSLRIHMRNIHPLSLDTEFRCELCHKGFSTQAGLDMHSYTRHPEAQKPAEHKCEQCGICYMKSKHLQEHIKKKHPSRIDPDYTCELYQKFTTQAGLETHSTWKCEICGSSYKDSTALQLHIKYKHTDLKYICKICNARYTTQRGLDKHSDLKHPVGTRYKCEICGSCYKKSTTLRLHIRKEHPSSIDSKYICNICNDKFKSQKGLDRHSFTMHPNTKTYLT